MTKDNFRNKIETIMTWEGGQRLFNFAYSIGAAIVILGALFKILHLSGGNTLLCIGMGTEVLMFILTAFDRPPKEYHWENVFPELDGHETERETIVGGRTNTISTPSAGNQATVSGSVNCSVGIPSSVNLSEEDRLSLSESIHRMSVAAEQLSKMAELTTATQEYLSQMSAISAQMEQLRQTTEALNSVSAVLLESYRAVTENSASITENSRGYIERMGDLNRNLGGLNTIYEIQLKSVSTQLDSIDRVNRGIKDIRDMYEKSASQSARYCEETEKMARYMQQLNNVYEKMLHAMTVNMYRPMMSDIPGAQSSGSVN
ncbi:gliding motility protein GldL [Duncaniella dubosii]|jgi:gliding motility-associated protein GldL|uniref:type IX secretion system motor protein PorL/GldL n=1 Tax=Duncaniella dubosii TaxID=2518971 RepID=UPI0025AF7389|nr:gliding motility protein GldL [uncultured Duncaniella sp.]